MYGYMPYVEDTVVDGFDLQHLMLKNPDKFWKFHQNIDGKRISEPFKHLFMSMTRESPAERASLEDIACSKWFNQEVYTPEELKSALSKMVTKRI